MADSEVRPQSGAAESWFNMDDAVVITPLTIGTMSNISNTIGIATTPTLATLEHPSENVTAAMSATPLVDAVSSSLCTTPPLLEDPKSVNSLQSANEFGQSCRICRYHQTDLPLHPSPCLCRGSVGFVHLSCLRRWMLHRRTDRCEICNSPMNIPENKVGFSKMLQSFLTYKCLGTISRNLLFIGALVPLGFNILNQAWYCIEILNQKPANDFGSTDVLTIFIVLLTYSAVFVKFFEFSTSRLFDIHGVLRHWWMFGGTPEFQLISIDSIEFFF